MTVPNERLVGKNEAWIEYQAPMTCFTEVHLSQALFHAKRYGLLGICVSRRFVLDRFGGPVHYVRNHKDECVIGNAQEILNVLKELGRPALLEYFGVNSAFIKSMSDANKDNFTYLDEQEWRIVHTHLQQEAGQIVLTDAPQPRFRIPIHPGDVRIVVFPDDETRTMAKCDSKLDAWLHAPANANTILLTLQECGHF